MGLEQPRALPCSPTLVYGMLALVPAEGTPLPRGISPVLKPSMELSTHEHSTGKTSTQKIGNVQPLRTCINDAAFNYVTVYYFFLQGMVLLGTQDGPQTLRREVRGCTVSEAAASRDLHSSAAEAARCRVNEAGL